MNKKSELEKKVVKETYDFIVQFTFAVLLFTIIFGIPYYLIH